MRRIFTGKELLIASSNKGKITEITALLTPYHIKCIAPASTIPIPEETGKSFIENAHLKSHYYSQKTGMTALADDSGLCIAALEGKPGIYSARWAEQAGSFALAMEEIHNQMKASPHKTKKAWFVCALSLCWPDGVVENFEGRVEGTITFPARGKHGFGYDPIFIAEGYQKTFAEMLPEEKHQMSHRHQAFQQFMTHCLVRQEKSTSKKNA